MEGKMVLYNGKEGTIIYIFPEDGCCHVEFEDGTDEYLYSGEFEELN